MKIMSLKLSLPKHSSLFCRDVRGEEGNVFLHWTISSVVASTPSARLPIRPSASARPVTPGTP
jgi:hypothetical protein